MTATGAGGRCGLVTDLAARQMRGQRLAFGLLFGLGRCRRRLQLLDLDGNGRQIGFDLVPIAHRRQTTVMMPASPMRCHGRPRTRAWS